jgi:hypothetical protein
MSSEDDFKPSKATKDAAFKKGSKQRNAQRKKEQLAAAKQEQVEEILYENWKNGSIVPHNPLTLEAALLVQKVLNIDGLAKVLRSMEYEACVAMGYTQIEITQTEPEKSIEVCRLHVNNTYGDIVVLRRPPEKKE